MRFSHLVVLLLFLLVMIGPVIAADRIRPLETVAIFETKAIDVIREQVAYPVSADVLSPLRSIIGRSPSRTVDVTINNEIVAIIPDNSKYNGMEVSKTCLIYQYGTEGWYNCEQRLTEKIRLGVVKAIPTSEVALR